MNTDNPLVSIIVPCYNQARFLSEAIRSVDEQTYKNTEVIIVNDGSKDNTEAVTLELVRQYPKLKIKYILQKNSGLSGARNTGLKAAQGEYVNFLDSDDVFTDSSKIEVQVAYLKSHKSCSIVYCDAEYFSEDKTLLEGRRIVWGDHTSGKVFLNLLRECNFILVHSVLIRREVMDTIGTFNENLHSMEDFDYWLRCAYAGLGFAYIDKVMVGYRIHGRNMTENTINMTLASIKFFEMVKTQYSLDNECLRVAELQIKNANLGLAVRYLQKGDIKKSDEHIHTAMCHLPWDPRAHLFYLAKLLLPRKALLILARPFIVRLV